MFTLDLKSGSGRAFRHVSDHQRPSSGFLVYPSPLSWLGSMGPCPAPARLKPALALAGLPARPIVTQPRDGARGWHKRRDYAAALRASTSGQRFVPTPNELVTKSTS